VRRSWWTAPSAPLGCSRLAGDLAQELARLVVGGDGEAALEVVAAALVADREPRRRTGPANRTSSARPLDGAHVLKVDLGLAERTTASTADLGCEGAPACATSGAAEHATTETTGGGDGGATTWVGVPGHVPVPKPRPIVSVW
jgi:hypothetical protein